MKKKRIRAILLASTIMMSLAGCNGSTSGSGEVEYTEAELRQAAREAMVATEDSSAAASSVDASTAASSVTDASVAASSDVTATTLATIPEAATSANPDAATTGASTVATADGSVITTSTQGQAAQAKLADHQFVYNGNENSILNDIGTIMSNLGRYQYRNADCPDQPYYAYKNGEVFFTTGILKGSRNGDELPLDISIYVKSVRTARNVGIGSHVSDINNAYSECNRSSFSLGGDYGIQVKFDTYSIYFYFDGKTDVVSYFVYENDVNLKAMYPNKADTKGTTQSSVTPNKASGANSNATQATATPAPAANNTAPAQTTNNTAPAPAPAPAPAATQNNVSASEGEVVYNGKKLSILDNLSTLMNNLGQCEKKDTSIAEEVRYVFDANSIYLYTFVNNGEELPYDLCIYRHGIKTSRNIGVGDSKDKIIEAYGDPTEVYSFYQGYGFKYKFDTFTLYFDLDSNTDRIRCITFGNNATIARRHAVHPDYIGD